MNLLYDHSLTPLRSQPKETDWSERNGYPGTDEIISKIGADRSDSIAGAVYKLGHLLFQFRYNSKGKPSFGLLTKDFLDSPHRLLIAIRKGTDENYSWVCVNLDSGRDYLSASWSINDTDDEAKHWSKFMPLEEANAQVEKLIRAAAHEEVNT